MNYAVIMEMYKYCQALWVCGIDGVVCDIQRLEKIKFQYLDVVFFKGSKKTSCSSKTHQSQQVEFVNPGDIIVADEEGICYSKKIAEEI